MATIAYRVAQEGGRWSVTREGGAGRSYVTKDAALDATFEAAAGEASGDLGSGHAIVIEVSPATDPRGAGDRGGSPIEWDGYQI
jgi:hypothetical protein